MIRIFPGANDCLRIVRRVPFVRAPALLAAGLLLGSILAGCKMNPADLYQKGYDKRLTEKAWAARQPDEAVVIIGGYPSVWQKMGEPGTNSRRGPDSPLGGPSVTTSH